jgi:hypothetical protein
MYNPTPCGYYLDYRRLVMANTPLITVVLLINRPFA